MRLRCCQRHSSNLLLLVQHTTQTHLHHAQQARGGNQLEQVLALLVGRLQQGGPELRDDGARGSDVRRRCLCGLRRER
jgi:hypothetical protein